MDRRLIIMRHAESPHGDATLSDHRRPLNDRGRNQAREIAGRIVKLGWNPQQVITSDAARALETWESMAPSFRVSPPVIVDESLYLAGVDAAHQALLAVSNEVSDVLMLGHNPGWESVIAYFCGEHHQMSPGTAALLHGTGDSWEDAADAGGFELVQLLRPG